MWFLIYYCLFGFIFMLVVSATESLHPHKQLNSFGKFLAVVFAPFIAIFEIARWLNEPGEETNSDEEEGL